MEGEVVGNFTIAKLIGAGGMGEVYLAEQRDRGTRAAIKLLQVGVSRDREHVQRFFNEARAVSRISHAGIVKIFAAGFTSTGRAYFVMELLEGEPLASVIARVRRLPLPQIAELGRQIASVLAATHAQGITHRDLKPDNIFIVADQELASGQRVKILDFGIAKLTGTLGQASPGTTSSMGTPAYMAPEQWGNSAEADWRSDLYSLGCVLFEMACGRPPFTGASYAARDQLQRRGATPLSVPVVQAVAEALIANPQVRIEIQGHVDAAADRELSHVRAEAVRALLIKDGVPGNRLEAAKGMGNDRRIDPSATPEAVRMNNRIELHVVP